ncbi:MAG: hypothetical protein E7261_12625 [Lachnospiraceae bacterium]|nr:hypothetical protein [Lachnospiraceae bacterium]
MNFFYEMIIGMFVIAFDAEYIIIENLRIDIVSDVIGCVLVIHALMKMRDWSPCFNKSIKMCVFYAIAIVVQRLIAYPEFTREYEYVVLGIATIFYINMVYNIMDGLFVKNKTEGIEEQNGNIKASSVTLCMIAGISCLAYIIGLDEVFAQYDMAGGEVVVQTICNILFYLATAFFAITLMQNKHELEIISKLDN